MMLTCLNICLLLLFFNVGEAVLDKPEGSECMVNKNKGICVNYQKCIALAVNLHNNYEDTEVELCSFDGYMPIVCCTGCDLKSNISNMVFTHSGQMRWTTDQISKEKCYSYSDAAFASDKCLSDDEPWTVSWDKQCETVSVLIPTAIGGRRARRNEFPHMALLGYGERLQTAEWLCGGSLISDRYILTAGHCTADTKLGPVKYAALGILRRSDPPHWWHRYEVKKITPHPDYHSPSVYNDIALLKLKISVKFGPSISPACLPYPTVEGVVGRQSVTATGWGAMGSNTLQGAETLQVIKVEEFTKRECTKRYKNKHHMSEGYNHTTQMCYGDHYRAIDTCKGDSGGPLQIDSELCMYVVIGVTSSGTPCGNVGGAGLYTRVRHFLPWIEEIVWADEVLTNNDIWRKLILKKIEEKRRRIVRSSVAPGVRASSMRSDKESLSAGTVGPDNSISPNFIDTESSIESSITIAKSNIMKLKSAIELNSTETLKNISNDSYVNVLSQNDWVAFLNKHKNESVSQKSNEWIGTEVPDLESASDKHSTSSTAKPDLYDYYDSSESDTDYDLYYLNNKNDSSEWTKSFPSFLESSETEITETFDFDFLFSTEPDVVSTESDLKLKEYEERITVSSGQSIRSNLLKIFELLMLTVFCNEFLRF